MMTQPQKPVKGGTDAHGLGFAGASAGAGAGAGAGASAMPTPALSYLYLALYAFALVGLELVLLAVEPVLGLTAGSLTAQLVHWALTIIVWAGGATIFLMWAVRRTDFRWRAAPTLPLTAGRWSTMAALVVVTVAAQWMLRGGAFAPVAEHSALALRFGALATVAWLVQVAYYFAEVFVIVLIIAFGQRAGEGFFSLRWVPWGGIVLGATWGLVHFLTQDAATGIYGIALSLVMGIVYLLSGKNLIISYPILLVMFIL